MSVTAAANSNNELGVQTPHRTLLDRTWRSAGASLVDLLAWALQPTWVSPEENPALSGARDRAMADIARMRSAPRPLAHPVVLMNGYHAWAGVVESICRKLAPITSGKAGDFLAVSFMDLTSFEAQRERALREVDRWVGLSTQVDVIGHSMGGVMGRACAVANHHDGRCLRVNRLITLASPHKGASLAKYVAPDGTARDMRAGSDFLSRLDASPTTIQRVMPFAHLRDPIVGARNTAPRGAEPYWCSGPRVLAHFSVPYNPIVLATIARELRGEEPLCEWPTSAPPRD